MLILSLVPPSILSLNRKLSLPLWPLASTPRTLHSAGSSSRQYRYYLSYGSCYKAADDNSSIANLDMSLDMSDHNSDFTSEDTPMPNIWSIDDKHLDDERRTLPSSYRHL